MLWLGVPVSGDNEGSAGGRVKLKRGKQVELAGRMKAAKLLGLATKLVPDSLRLFDRWCI